MEKHSDDAKPTPSTPENKTPEAPTYTSTEAGPSRAPQKQAAQSAARARKTAAQKSYRTIEDVIRAAYESKKDSLEIPRKHLEGLSVTDDSLKIESDLVLSFASKDPLLDGAVKILCLVAQWGDGVKPEESSGVAPALKRLTDLSILAMSKSVVFAVWTDELVPPTSTGRLTPQHLVDIANMSDVPRSRQMTPADRSRLAKNAVTSFGLLRIIQRLWTPGDFIREVNKSVWYSQTPKGENPLRQVGYLARSREPAALGIVASYYLDQLVVAGQVNADLKAAIVAGGKRESELSEISRRAADIGAKREEEISKSLAASIEREERAKQHCEELAAEISRLSNELANERNSRSIDSSHFADDYETLRTGVVRVLTAEINMLTDGLHAMRNGATAVAEEFVDRSLTALSRELEHLKIANGGSK